MEGESSCHLLWSKKPGGTNKDFKSVQLGCYQLNTLAIDPDSDIFNNRINCCYVSDLYSLDSHDDVLKIATGFSTKD